MREILFRGKTIKDGKWVYGVPMQHVFGDFQILSGRVGAMCIDTVASETIGQYTGLHDMDGNKIFEGDIFRLSDKVWSSCYTSCGTEYDSWDVENYGVVGFDEENARFDFVQYKFGENSVEADLHENRNIEFAEFVSNLEIIGNIHDNPELLKGDKNE